MSKVTSDQKRRYDNIYEVKIKNTRFSRQTRSFAFSSDKENNFNSQKTYDTRADTCANKTRFNDVVIVVNIVVVLFYVGTHTSKLSRSYAPSESNAVFDGRRTRTGRFNRILATRQFENRNPNLSCHHDKQHVAFDSYSSR